MANSGSIPLELIQKVRERVTAPSMVESVRAWSKLCRLPRACVAMAETVAGAIIVGAGFAQFGTILGVTVGSGLLLAGSGALNDWHDYKRDREENPDRPLPSHRINRWVALPVIALLLIVGVLFVRVGPALAGEAALGMLALILFHELLIKDIPIAPVVLGLIGAGHMLIGMSIVPVEPSAVDWLPRIALLLAFGIYATGLAVFSHAPTSRQMSNHQILGVCLLAVPVFVLMGVGILFSEANFHTSAFPWIAIFVVIVGYRVTQTLLTPTRTGHHRATEAAILGRALLACAAVAYFHGFAASLPVALLIVPAFALQRLENRKKAGDTPSAFNRESIHDSTSR
jgi:hypothetical protein